MIIRKLRLDRGWSQEQLAEASGVSTRTIQRIERGKKASLESLKCLAAVFETDFNTLRQDDTMTETSHPNDTPLSDEDRKALAAMKEWMKYDKGAYIDDSGLSTDEREAMEYVRDIKAFYVNFMGYVIVMVFLLIINLLTGPGYLWVVWPALGWGLGIALHALAVFEVFSPFGTDWEKRQINKRLRK